MQRLFSHATTPQVFNHNQIVAGLFVPQDYRGGDTTVMQNSCNILYIPAMAIVTVNYGCKPLEYAEVWINEDVACSPPLELPSYLKDRIESRKRKMW